MRVAAHGRRCGHSKKAQVCNLYVCICISIASQTPAQHLNMHTLWRYRAVLISHNNRIVTPSLLILHDDLETVPCMNQVAFLTHVQTEFNTHHRTTSPAYCGKVRSLMECATACIWHCEHLQDAKDYTLAHCKGGTIIYIHVPCIHFVTCRVNHRPPIFCRRVR